MSPHYIDTPVLTAVPHYTTSVFDIDFQAVFPELFLAATTIALLVYGVVYSTTPGRQYPVLVHNMALLVVLSMVYTVFLVANSPMDTAVVLYNTYILDQWTGCLKVLILGATLVTVLLSLDYIRTESLNAFETVILVALSTVSMLCLVSANDWISLYLAVELQSLCAYVLAAVKRNSEFATEAGLKYFLLGAFSSGVLLFGCSLIYGFTGVTNFGELAQVFTGGPEDILLSTTSLPACQLGMVLVLVGFLFKVAAAPFHMWSPDVYEGAPTPITAYFVIVPKVALFGVFVRVFMESFYDFMGSWQPLVVLASLVSMVVGCLAALAQTRLKRLLAWSSVGHVGYMLAGLACGTIEGVQAVVMYLVVYIAMNVSLFALVLTRVRRPGGGVVPRLKYITDLAYLAQTNPLLAATATITLFSMAGIPPLAGFYSKAYLFFATMSSALYLVAIVGVLTSVVSCFYYIRLVKIMYFETPATWSSVDRVARANALALGLALALMVCLMAYPAPLHLVTHGVALALCV